MKKKSENMFKVLLGFLKLNKQRQPALRQFDVVRLCLEPEEMNEWQKTDIIINIMSCPFATLTESKLPNTWYHHDDRIDCLFELCDRGFRLVKGSKSAINKLGLLRRDA